jgi:hypothetical protein
LGGRYQRKVQSVDRHIAKHATDIRQQIRPKKHQLLVPERIGYRHKQHLPLHPFWLGHSSQRPASDVWPVPDELTE